MNLRTLIASAGFALKAGKLKIAQSCTFFLQVGRWCPSGGTFLRVGFIDYLLNNSAESSHTCVFRFSTRNLGLDIEKICQTAEVLSLAGKSSPDSAHRSDSQLTDRRICSHKLIQP